MASEVLELSDEFTEAAERAFLRKLPEGALGTDDQAYVSRFEKAYVTRAMKRLNVLQKVITRHVGEPIIYHAAHLSMIGSLKAQSIQHIQASIISDPELTIAHRRWIGINTEKGTYSTKVGGKLEQGYRQNPGFCLQIDNLLYYHINGDVNENQGFLVGSRMTEHFLAAIGPEQTDFIKQNLGFSSTP